jgi:6-phosphogluconate dehydrogenase
MSAKAEFGVIGLGRMGGNLARQALEKKIGVAGFTLGPVPQDLTGMGLIAAGSLRELEDALIPPRAVFLYIPAGPVVDTLIGELEEVLEKGDIIVDGGNSYWGDSIRRAEKLKKKGLYLVDLGTSGGVEGARHGACFMAGGEEYAVKRIEPVLLKLAVQGGYVHTGKPGTGHFAKLVHNGIEFGMLQAIGEGLDLLEHYPPGLDIPGVLACWRHGSVIRSWLIDLMEEQYRERGGLEKVPPYVEDTGEVNWLVADALNMEVSVPVIALAVMQLFASRDSGKDWARAIAMMRHGFGGHPFGADESIVRERRQGRVGDIVRGDKKG